MTDSTAPYQAPPDGWRTFLIVWISQSVSVFGSALTQFAIIVWLTTTLYPTEAQKPQLAWAISALTLSFAIPAVFLAPIAGAFVDRHDRKRTMIAMDVASGLLSLGVFYLIATHQLNIIWLIIIGLLGSTFFAFHNAAFDTSYAMLVPEEKLPRANGMMQTIFSLSGILSPGIAATLIVLPTLARDGKLPVFASLLGQVNDGALLAIGVDAATFFFAALAPAFLFIPSPKRTDMETASGEKKSLWADVREGALYIWHRRSFLWLLGTFTVANFTAGALVLQPLIVKFQLNADWLARGFTFESAMATLATAGSIGGVVGGVAVSAWGGLKKKRVYGVLVALIFSGLAMTVYGFSKMIFLSAAAAFMMEGLIPVMNSHSQTIWQTQTPRELQGRVFSVRRLIAQFSWPASTFLMGALASQFDPGRIIMVLGAVLAVWCVIGLFNPFLMRVEDKEWIEAQALKNAGQESVAN
ncbi:MAG: MFS transporter [Chloroflexi bacterium]|nr:MFS transporter [Chloroflexota bacterium]